MSKFELIVDKVACSSVTKFRRWDKEQAAKDVMREYASEEGMYSKSDSKLQELLDERHRLAMTAQDENVKLKAIDSSLNMAAGPIKDASVNNTQINIKSFFGGLKDE